MIINTPVSLGELVDKISILHIKNINIKDDEKLALVRDELLLLNKTLDAHINRDDIQQYLDSLIDINSKLISLCLDPLGIKILSFSFKL